MQILLASAKIMNSETSLAVPTHTHPKFFDQAQSFALELSNYSVEELAQKLGCSTKIALENKLRYQDFLNTNAYLPAILAYYGQAYKCLKAQNFTDEDFRYANDHLFISSFLYGLLRPLDDIHPYRLEGKIVLNAANDQNIFAYWKPFLTDILIHAVKNDDGILVHLATAEFQHLFDWKRILKEVHVIQPLFMVDQGTKLRAVSMYAKSCRGAMTSYIIKNKITNPSELLSFRYDGFEYKDRYGDADHPHFILNQ